MSEWVTVLPEKGKEAETARALLALADPRDVRTDGNGTEFLVPQAVADAYMGVGVTAEEKPKRRPRASKKDEGGDE